MLILSRKVWSAPNYCYRCGNVASILSFNENMEREVKFFTKTEENNQMRGPDDEERHDQHWTHYNIGPITTSESVSSLTLFRSQGRRKKDRPRYRKKGEIYLRRFLGNNKLADNPAMCARKSCNRQGNNPMANNFTMESSNNSMLRRLVEERRACQETKHDMLGLLMNGGEENRYNLTDEKIIDQMIAILYSEYETVSITSMMAVKYLHDHPNVLQELRKEHLAIRERKRAEDPINWNDFKSMNFTRSVIFETSRLATIVNGVLRKTTQDIKISYNC
ncbi:unnamed protein product [Camellia sinensis]